MDLQLITSVDALDRLGPEWNELVAASDVDSPFLQWEWCSTWWRHYGGGHELAIVLARDGGRLIGLAPLFIERGLNGASRGTLKFLGTGEVCSEYLSFVLRRGDEESAAVGVLDFLLRGATPPWRQMRLTHVPESGQVARLLQANFSTAGRAFRVERGATSWSIELAATWDELLHRVSRGRREKLRRALRNVAKSGFEFCEATREDQLNAAWADLTRLHGARWEQVGKRGRFASPRFAAFHSELLHPLWRRGMITLTSLRSGGHAVAASYCLRHRGRVYFYQSGVDPAWMHCQPGHSLRVCELQRAIERGDRVFDFLSGDEEYKTQWATARESMVNFVVAGRGLMPRVRVGLESAIYWAKESARNRVPAKALATLRRWKNRWKYGSPPAAAPSKSEEPAEIAAF